MAVNKKVGMMKQARLRLSRGTHRNYYLVKPHTILYLLIQKRCAFLDLQLSIRVFWPVEIEPKLVLAKW